MKLKSFPVKNKYLIYIFQKPYGFILVNWFFQGVRGMQKKELAFRMFLELFLFCLLFTFLYIPYNFDIGVSLISGFFISHTLNWLFNTHLWVCLRYMKIYKRNPDALRLFLNKVSYKLNKKSWVDEAVCIGSVGDKGDVSSWRSDIDLRLFFRPGFVNFLRLNFYLIYLRTWALFTVIPLDLYAYDDIEYLAQFKSDEGIKVIKDVNGRIKRRFASRIMG